MRCGNLRYRVSSVRGVSTTTALEAFGRKFARVCSALLKSGTDVNSEVRKMACPQTENLYLCHPSRRQTGVVDAARRSLENGRYPGIDLIVLRAVRFEVDPDLP